SSVAKKFVFRFLCAGLRAFASLRFKSRSEPALDAHGDRRALDQEGLHLIAHPAIVPLRLVEEILHAEVDRDIARKLITQVQVDARSAVIAMRHDSREIA